MANAEKIVVLWTENSELKKNVLETTIVKLFVDPSEPIVLPSGCECVLGVLQCSLRLWGYPVRRQSRGTTHLECYKSRILSRICGLLVLNCHKMNWALILNSVQGLPDCYLFPSDIRRLTLRTSLFARL